MLSQSASHRLLQVHSAHKAIPDSKIHYEKETYPVTGESLFFFAKAKSFLYAYLKDRFKSLDRNSSKDNPPEPTTKTQCEW